jgi:hypothetical protein
VNTAEAEHPAWYSPEHCSITDDGTRSRCGATHGAQSQPASTSGGAGKCTRGGLDWACTVIGVLPTPQLRTGAFLAVLRAEVATRSGNDPAP